MLPFVLNVFLKIDAFQEIRKLNKQWEDQYCNYKANRSNYNHIPRPTWDQEKLLMMFLYRASIKLSSTITVKKLLLGVNDSASMQKYEKHGLALNIEDGEFYSNMLKNLEVRGFLCDPKGKNETEGYSITKRGLLMGEVVNDLYKHSSHWDDVDNPEYKLLNKSGMWCFYWISLSIQYILVFSLVVVAIDKILNIFGLVS